jgi:hypothetical protein
MSDRRRAALAAAGALAYAAAVLVADPFHRDLPTCPFLAVTGWHCPGCGSTRAAWLLLHGDLPGAVATNALVLPIAVLLAARWLHLAVPAATVRLPEWLRQPTTIPRPAVLGLAVAFAGFAVARNVAPFAALAP